MDIGRGFQQSHFEVPTGHNELYFLEWKLHFDIPGWIAGQWSSFQRGSSRYWTQTPGNGTFLFPPRALVGRSGCLSNLSPGWDHHQLERKTAINFIIFFMDLCPLSLSIISRHVFLFIFFGVVSEAKLQGERVFFYRPKYILTVDLIPGLYTGFW